MTQPDKNPKAGASRDDALDAALRGWAGANRADSGDGVVPEHDVPALVEAINRRVAAPAEPRPRNTPNLRRVIALAIAASLLLAVGVSLRQEASTNPASPLPAVSALSDEDVSRQRRLVRGVYDLFGDRLTWLTVAPEGLQMGIDEESERALDDLPTRGWDRFTAFRLVLVRRPSAGSAWETVREMDVLAPPEAVVAVDGIAFADDTSKPAAALQLWSFPLPDGGVAVDLEGALPVFGDLGSGGSHVLQPGEVRPVAQATADGWEYQLLQSAMVVAAS